MPTAAKSPAEMQNLVRESRRVLPVGGRTKPALSRAIDGEEILDMTEYSGVVEYEPGEFTITVKAGTRLTEMINLLAEQGQYLPFDPLFARRGATIGGTVAAGASGPGRFHYGGVRDFILGVLFINGSGELVRSGGKVVKNAAGFDFTKLMVGSIGKLGVLVEMSFKVFPRPESFGSLRLTCNSLTDALQQTYRLVSQPIDLDALDLFAEPGGWCIWARLGGLTEALPDRLHRLSSMVGGGEIIVGSAEIETWSQANELSWAPDGWSVVKAPLTPSRIEAFEAALQREQDCGLVSSEVKRRYSSAGQVAWLAMQESPSCLDELLTSLGLSGLALIGPAEQSRLGFSGGVEFARRVKLAFDPEERFSEHL